MALYNVKIKNLFTIHILHVLKSFYINNDPLSKNCLKRYVFNPFLKMVTYANLMVAISHERNETQNGMIELRNTNSTSEPLLSNNVWIYYLIDLFGSTTICCNFCHITSYILEQLYQAVSGLFPESDRLIQV